MCRCKGVADLICNASFLEVKRREEMRGRNLLHRRRRARANCVNQCVNVVVVSVVVVGVAFDTTEFSTTIEEAFGSIRCDEFQ